MGVIYKLTFPNGKSYIGYTTQPVRKRFDQHKYDSKTGGRSVLHNAIRLYGPPEISILFEANLPELLDAEVRLIDEHNTLVPNGYNVLIGGQISPMIGNPHKPETLARMSASMMGKPSNRKGTKLSEETKARMRGPRVKRPRSEGQIATAVALGILAKGRIMSKETRARMSIASTGRLHTEDAKARISKTLSGRPHSEERSQNIALGRIKARAARKLIPS